MEDTETPPLNYTREEYYQLKRATKRMLCKEYIDLVKRGFEPNRSTLREKYTIEGTKYPCKTTVNQWINKLPPIEPVGSDDASDLWYLFTTVKYTYPCGSSSSPLPMYPGSPEGDLFEHL